MNFQEFADKHGLALSTVRVKASQIGFSEPIGLINQEQLLAFIKGPAHLSESSQPQEEEQPEKPKRSRKKDTQLAKKAASDLENNASAAGVTQANFATAAATVKAQEMVATADVVSATGYSAFTARLAQNDASFLSWFANGTNEAIANNANAASPGQILSELGIPSAQESLGKLQRFSTKLSNVEDAETALRFYDN